VVVVVEAGGVGGAMDGDERDGRDARFVLERDCEPADGLGNLSQRTQRGEARESDSRLFGDDGMNRSTLEKQTW